MKSGKLLKISDERSIYIIQNEDESYIDKNNSIRYRNIGVSFDIHQINDSFVNIDNKGNMHVLDAVGNSKFYFPSVWLDTDMMAVYELQEKGIIQLK
jgi:hypothetical protein